jgi:hypothetical protein
MFDKIGTGGSCIPSGAFEMRAEPIETTVTRDDRCNGHRTGQFNQAVKTQFKRS